MKLFYQTAFLLMCVNGKAEDSTTLELVHVFFRHGSRTPDKHETYPTDPHLRIQDFNTLPDGLLTIKGHQQAYKLGKILRDRYKNFIGEIYTPDVLLAKTTDFDRTKMTLLLVLASLFPPSPQQTWNDNLNWIPIPYHYSKQSVDYELLNPSNYCPAYANELQRVLASDSVAKFITKHASTFEYVSNHSGIQMTTLLDMFGLYQTLSAELNMNLTLPKWTEKVYPEELRKLATEQLYLQHSTPILKRLNGGRILKKVILNMEKKATNVLQPAGRKMFLYSAHDNNVMNILAVLDLFNPHFPDYCSATLIELHRSETADKHFVKMVYLKNVESAPEEMTIPGCSVLCPLYKFLEISEPYIPLNHTKECESAIELD